MAPSANVPHSAAARAGALELPSKLLYKMPPPPERSRTSIQRSAGGIDIIYQQHPEVVNSRALVNSIGTPHGAPTLAHGEPELVGARTCAQQEVRTAREAEAAGERPGNELGLIVASFPEAGGMLGHRHHDVYVTQRRWLPSDLHEPPCEPAAERNDLMVFQQNDGAGHRRCIGAITARKIEIVDTAPTSQAECIRYGFRGDS